MEVNNLDNLLYDGWENDPHDVEWYDWVFSAMAEYYSSDLMEKILKRLKIDSLEDQVLYEMNYMNDFLTIDPALFFDYLDEDKFTPEYDCEWEGAYPVAVTLSSGLYMHGFYDAAYTVASGLLDMKCNLREIEWTEELAINWARAILDNRCKDDGECPFGSEDDNFDWGLWEIEVVWKFYFKHNTPSGWAASILNDYGCKLMPIFDENMNLYGKEAYKYLKSFVLLCFQIAAHNDDMEDALVSQYFIKYGNNAKFWKMIDHDDRISGNGLQCELTVFHSEHHEGKLIKRPDKKGGKSGKKGESRRHGLPKPLKLIYKAYKIICK